MIGFPCNCGYRFTVTDDLAGSMIQCPQCKRLNDIPTLTEVANLDDGGIYKLEADPTPKPDPHRVEELTYIFTRERFDENGEPIDIRGPVTDGPDNAGPIPVESLGPLDSAPPKYDPVTGELVRELEIKPDTGPSPDTIPLARPAKLPPLKVMNGMDIPAPLEVFVIPLRLLRPQNFLVMVFILIAHAVGAGLAMVLAGGLFIAVPIWGIWHGLILAHYGNVIDETGPGSHDELPAPLRHLGWHEDIWGPFVQVASAMMVCYVPCFVILMYRSSLPAPVCYGLAAAALVAGTVFFPAALITTTTSGTTLNLRPDRLCGVIHRCGIEYGIAVMLWIFGGLTALLGFIGITGGAAAMLLPASTVKPWFLRAEFAWSLLACGTFLLHYFCWHLGTLYRKHFASFPWVLQRHERSKNRAFGFPVKRAPRPRPMPPRQPPKGPTHRVQPLPPPRHG